jgi:hypothetical protein
VQKMFLHYSMLQYFNIFYTVPHSILRGNFSIQFYTVPWQLY